MPVKVTDLAREAAMQHLPPLQKKVLDYLMARGDEVVAYRDEAAARDLGLKTSAFGFALWALRKKGLIEEVRVGRRVYFGSSEAVAKAHQALQQARKALQKAREVRRCIQRRAGIIDGLALLEQSRARA